MGSSSSPIAHSRFPIPDSRFPAVVKLAVFSDLHLAPGGANRCQIDPKRLLEMFDRIEEAADRVVVGGDLFDLDRPRVPGDWRGQLEAVRRTYPALLARLESYEWIFGNHDAALRFEGVPEERAFVADGLRVLVVHGHQWDMLLKRIPLVAPVANFTAGWLERTALRRASGVMAKVPLILDKLWHRGRAAAGPDRSLAGATELLAQEWDVVICGHTHRLRLEATDPGLFANSGAICEGHTDWILIDTAERRAQAYRDGRVVAQATGQQDSWKIGPA